MNPSFRILLIEDNEGDVEMVKCALRDAKASVSVAVANDGLDALAALRGSAGAKEVLPHIMLLDLNMPRMDGKKFLEVVKADAELKQIPVVMLTSSQSQSDIRECYARHASCYVVKPFDGSEFAMKVREVVRYWSQIGQLP